MQKEKGGLVLTVRVTREQHIQLQERAIAAGMGVSDYVRGQLFGTTSPTNSRYDTLAAEVKTIHTAMKLAGLESHITHAQGLLGKKEE